MTKLPRVGLMLGDMTGIGPEISVRLLASGALRDVAEIGVVGDKRFFELGCRDAGVAPPEVDKFDVRRRDTCIAAAQFENAFVANHDDLGDVAP